MLPHTSDSITDDMSLIKDAHWLLLLSNSNSHNVNLLLLCKLAANQPVLVQNICTLPHYHMSSVHRQIYVYDYRELHIQIRGLKEQDFEPTLFNNCGDFASQEIVRMM
jgi:hypothetical protein